MIKKKNEKIKKMYEQNIRKIFKKKRAVQIIFLRKETGWVGGGRMKKTPLFLVKKIWFEAFKHHFCTLRSHVEIFPC